MHVCKCCFQFEFLLAFSGSENSLETMMILLRNCLYSNKNKNSIFHRKHLRLGIKCRITGGFRIGGNIDGNKGNKFFCV